MSTSQSAVMVGPTSRVIFGQYEVYQVEHIARRPGGDLDIVLSATPYNHRGRSAYLGFRRSKGEWRPLAGMSFDIATAIHRAEHEVRAAAWGGCDLQPLFTTLDPAPIYLVWSNEHRSWWGPNNSNYTGDVWSAGRYDEANAIKACGMRSWSQGTPPPEVMVLAPEDGRQFFAVDDIRAVHDLMRQRIDEATKTASAARGGGR